MIIRFPRRRRALHVFATIHDTRTCTGCRGRIEPGQQIVYPDRRTDDAFHEECWP